MLNDKSKYYCGSVWIPGWIRRILSIRFDREETDTRFLLHMIRQCKGNIFWEIIATFYYIFVRILGKLSWGNKEEHY